MNPKLFNWLLDYFNMPVPQFNLYIISLCKVYIVFVEETCSFKPIGFILAKEKLSRKQKCGNISRWKWIDYKNEVLAFGASAGKEWSTKGKTSQS